MNNITFKSKAGNSRAVKLVAVFGKARLCRCLDGGFILQGGTESDRTAAREWISLFLHEAVPKIIAV